MGKTEEETTNKIILRTKRKEKLQTSRNLKEKSSFFFQFYDNTLKI